MFLDAYRAAVRRGKLLPDPAQAAAAERLQEVFDHLTRRSRAPAVLRSRLARVVRRRRPDEPDGLWLWGGVGSGKTCLMDLFFHTLPLRKKRRLHFHRLMRFVHLELKRLGERRDPLDRIAAQLAHRYRVLCLDEFFVADIANAMILGELLDGLCRRRAVLVATSNTHPDGLYEGGLQRARFLPAIALLKRRLLVHELSAGTDYRTLHLSDADTYCVTPAGTATPALERHFDRVASELVRADTAVEVAGRQIPVRRLSHDAIWFDFDALCATPRSVDDYIEIARCFGLVLLSGVPAFGPEDDDAARRFVHLIDELYDRGVKLAVSAAAPPGELYRGARLAREFERAASRLREMGTAEYLARPHRAH